MPAAKTGLEVIGRRLQVNPDVVAVVLEYFNLAVVVLPITLALAVTINARMAWRDKWSVCIMGADTLAAEIYKFRMQTCEYDQSKPPGKNEDGEDLPPLSQKEKSRRARMLFVSRVQAIFSACMTEISQTSSLKFTRVSKRKQKVSPKNMLVARSNQEEKPTLSQWWKLKVHIEHHYYRSAWAFPQGISFLTWMSALRPYLSQRTAKEEMKTVITSLMERGKLSEARVFAGSSNPLTDEESNLIRRSFSSHLGLPPNLFDGVKDEIRLLQRQVVVQVSEEQAKKIAKQTAATGSPDDPEDSGAGLSLETTVTNPGMAAAVMMAQNKVAPMPKTPGDMPADEHDIRELIMEMQGLGKPKEDEGKKLVKLKKQQQKKQNDKSANVIDDDYLAGPLSVDSYMAYRIRPAISRLQKHVNKLSWRLSGIEIAGFVIQSSGSVMGTLKFDEWVALTVVIAAVLQGFIEFMQLRNQVTSINLALRDLQGLTVFWDSLSIVRRRTPAVKMQMVKTTESALLLVVQSHTTASANTITSVVKQLTDEQAEAEANADDAE